MALTDREIDMSHTINDLLNQLAALRRCVERQLDLLDVVPHAISHGRISVAVEYVERVTVSLRNELDGTGIPIFREEVKPHADADTDNETSPETATG